VQRALVNLGFREREADRAVATLDPLAWHRPPDVLIREALRVLAGAGVGALSR
jgi:Holliday junction resolvasome RuvABC DNA-binding subunit